MLAMHREKKFYGFKQVKKCAEYGKHCSCCLQDHKMVLLGLGL